LNIKGISGEELTGTENYSMLIIEWKEIIEMWLIEIGDSTMERTVTRMELEMWIVMLIGIGIDIITIIEYNSIISGLLLFLMLFVLWFDDLNLCLCCLFSELLFFLIYFYLFYSNNYYLF
jgi:hypothetical protein